MTKAQIKIPFHLCDPAKILFFGSLYEIYHQFLEDHISDLGVSWKDWFQGEAGSPIRGLKTSYNHPLKFGVTYQAELSVVKVGDSTVSFLFEVKGEAGVHAATEVTHCFVDPKKRSKTAVPKTIKEALIKHLQV
jgi:acyl-CoA thioesterase FadM